MDQRYGNIQLLNGSSRMESGDGREEDATAEKETTSASDFAANHSRDSPRQRQRVHTAHERGSHLLTRPNIATEHALMPSITTNETAVTRTSLTKSVIDVPERGLARNNTYGSCQGPVYRQRNMIPVMIKQDDCRGV